MRSNREIVLAAVRRPRVTRGHWGAVSPYRYHNCRVIESARDGVALAYASEELRGDAEVLAAAVWKPMETQRA